MEVSSHGIDQERHLGIDFQGAVFTNLSHDHLDYHPSIEDYLAAKLRLFTELLQPGQAAVINADGPYAERAIAAALGRGLNLITTGMSGETLRLVAAEPQGFTQILTVAYGGKSHRIELPLLGDYQGSNALVACGFAIATGEDPVAAIEAMASSSSGIADGRSRLCKELPMRSARLRLATDSCSRPSPSTSDMENNSEDDLPSSSEAPGSKLRRCAREDDDP